MVWIHTEMPYHHLAWVKSQLQALRSQPFSTLNRIVKPSTETLSGLKTHV